MKLFYFHLLSAFVAADTWQQAKSTDNDCLSGEGAVIVEDICSDLYYGVCQTIKVNKGSSCNIDIRGDAELTFYSSQIQVQYWPMYEVEHDPENEDPRHDDEPEYINIEDDSNDSNDYGEENASFAGWLLAKVKLQ
jgi:hypothetical protein